MILLLLAAVAAPALASRCPAGASADAAVCRALEANAAGRPADAAFQFEAAAAAGKPGDPATARALAAAGNLWIAAGQPGKAALDLDRALAGTGLQAEQRGEALLDRARAAEAQNDLKTARAKVSEATATISGDAFLWYFSTALAIREGDVPAAKLAIGRALTLAPNDPTVLFEAGHVSSMAGEEATARNFWTRAAAGDPTGATGKAAREALAMSEVPLSVRRPVTAPAPQRAPARPAAQPRS
ncbi:hypothetical protein HMF7854_01570 [Sphingomonas ginkgonis]|uniref:Uncharacterized protein n=1 Tax=Sphingomonas ginkgonis TaxID=2315330 RepID=A0A3R9WNI2_9SPHN|nr:hypothetical protein [Sphingomonas ginkgonis]RST29659.1 hypothetical protein HMF7854_01570 [Sphingomonas ginkgonis]